MGKTKTEKERNYLNTIRKRIAHLEERVRAADERGQVLSYDIVEVRALRWLMGLAGFDTEGGES